MLKVLRGEFNGSVCGCGGGEADAAAEVQHECGEGELRDERRDDDAHCEGIVARLRDRGGGGVETEDAQRVREVPVFHVVLHASSASWDIRAHLSVDAPIEGTGRPPLFSRRHLVLRKSFLERL